MVIPPDGLTRYAVYVSLEINVHLLSFKKTQSSLIPGKCRPDGVELQGKILILKIMDLWI